MILPEDILKHLVEVDAALIKALRLVAKHCLTSALMGPNRVI
ncbi:hypothetical protein [Ruegeria atlantica]|uniref:Uncharacterized protein n=1 Tax=Ruegeria atlantica TaxID=81569 RepID=A0A0N7LNK8_9RHOB|nr:hypothetical protein [Ruegeria atlantica]CUH42700.1 hypothetical protein RUM4293_01589 [Ruegeria atlantica]